MLSKLRVAVSLHSVLHRKSAKERKALWVQQGNLTSEAGYKTKCPNLRNTTRGTRDNSVTVSNGTQ